MAPNWTWTLKGRNTLHTRNTYPWSPNCAPFHSTTSNFQDTRSPKIGNAANDPKLNLNILQSKVLYIHRILTPEAQILVHFALRLSISEIQVHQKSEMHWLTRKWTWTLKVKSILYTRNTYPWSPKFGPFHSTMSDFQDTRSPKIGNAPNGPKLNLNP